MTTEDTENTEAATPETDAQIDAEMLCACYPNQYVDAEFARKLERERDDLLQELEEYRSIAENIGAKKAVSEKEKAIRERDEARAATKLAYCILANVNRPSREAAYARSAIKHVNDTPMDWLQSLIQKWKEGAK